MTERGPHGFPGSQVCVLPGQGLCPHRGAFCCLFRRTFWSHCLVWRVAALSMTRGHRPGPRSHPGLFPTSMALLPCQCSLPRAARPQPCTQWGGLGLPWGQWEQRGVAQCREQQPPPEGAVAPSHGYPEATAPPALPTEKGGSLRGTLCSGSDVAWGGYITVAAVPSGTPRSASTLQ